MKKLIFAGLVSAVLSCTGSDQDFCFDEMTYSPSQTVFKLFAPADAECFVVVGDEQLPMQLGADSIWTATATGDRKGQTYQFVVDGQASPGVFAKAVTVNGEKGVVVDLRDTDPEGWGSDEGRSRLVTRPDGAKDGIVVYEMHHRDFSVGRPGAQHPGKFLALTEPWAIDHLKELGVNMVHILPSYDFGSVDETRLDEPQYNWGYDPVNYNVPEGSYSTDPTDPLCRIREFKQMVKALHDAGIGVILDVVYNHTYDIEHSNFQRTYPDYYYRVVPNGGESIPPSAVTENLPSLGEGSGVGFYSNGSGCGNETASEQPMMRRFMMESVKYWLREYHIDGFRFDLMGVHDIETMNEIRQAVDAIDPTIFIYGEGWSAGACALPNEQLAMKAHIAQMPGIAAFSDDLRDALRGPFSDDTKGAFLAGLSGEEESLKAGIAGMIEHPQVDYSKVNYSKAPYAAEPTQMIAYVSCHDDMCLVDRLKASVPSLQGNHNSCVPSLQGNHNSCVPSQQGNHNSQFSIPNSQLISLDLLAQTAVFTSQGVPFMLSGEELLRTKQGVHNSFESPDSINQLDWSNKERYPQVFEYYKNLIALRRHHPAFHLGKADLVRRHLEFLPTDDCLVAFRLKNHAGGDEWADIIVILNANSEPREVAIPEGQYTAVCRDGVIDEQGLGTVSGATVTVSPQSALILHN